MKKFIVIFFSMALAVGIVIGLPLYIKQDSHDIVANMKNEVSLVNQEIISYGENINYYKKIYADGKLVGVTDNIDMIYQLIDEKSLEYQDEFPGSQLGLGDDIYVVDEASFANFKNADVDIVNYLHDNNFLGIKTTAVEFSTSKGIYDIIYVKNIEDFYSARDEFLINFVSEDTLRKLNNKEQIKSPTELGTVETNLKVLEVIKYEDATVSPTVIYTNADEIYDYLCYGRNTDREYYTVVEGDTLQGVGYYFYDMSPKQIMMLNKGVLNSENQVITPGMQLNVTYYTSPITVDVTKQVLSQEYITPESPEYVQDDSLAKGEVKILIQEEVGIKNVLFEETWTNGVLQEGKQLSETVIKQPVRGQIAVGTKYMNLVGTGKYVWPVDNPHISCHWGCYFNHTGTDFINKYNHYGPAYAVDSGVVVQKGYKNDMGNYIFIDHQNGVRTFYMHLNVPAYVEVGESVTRGQVIGQIGNTGNSSGAHLHLTFEVNGKRVNACNYLPCSILN